MLFAVIVADKPLRYVPYSQNELEPTKNINIIINSKNNNNHDGA